MEEEVHHPEKYTHCPFCQQNGFDLIGLKHHLYHYCEAFDHTLSVEEERELRRQKEKANDSATAS